MGGALYRSLGIAIVSCAVVACGGGGGSTTAGPPATPTPTSAGSATPAPTSTPAYTGRVVDADHGNVAVAGASVSVGGSFVYGSAGYVLGGVTATATTAPDGTFAVPATGSPSYVQVSAGGSSQLVPLHRPLPAAPAPLGTLTLRTATTDEIAGLAELNKHRAQLGSGAGSLALSLDADLVQLARYRANDMATQGYFSHVAPGQSRAASYVYLCTISVGAFCADPIFTQENIAADSASLVGAEDAFIAAGASDGHYQNVVSKTNLWIGFGEAFNGKPASGFTGSTASYFAQTFFTTTSNPLP